MLCLRLRLRRCRETCEQRSLPASLAGIRIAHPADASHPWAWLPSLRTNWEEYFPSRPFSKLPSRLASTERSTERSIKSQGHDGYCRKKRKVQQPGKKEEFICEEYIPSETFDLTT